MTENSIPIELRAHHLRNLKHIHGVSREEYFRTLNEDPNQEDIPRKTSWVPYVDSPNDPFMTVGYDNLKAILRNPIQKIILIEDKPDFICSACPARVKAVCSAPKKYSPNSNTFDATPSKVDRDFAQKFGLKIGETYSARDVIRALNLEQYYLGTS